MRNQRAHCGLSLMKHGICLSVLLLGWVTIAYGDFVLKQTGENFGQRQQVTIKLKGSKCRIDTSSDTSAIIDSQAGTVILFHHHKMFMKISSGQLTTQAEAIKKIVSA